MRFFFRPTSPRRQRRAARTLSFQSLEAREVFSVGLAYVGLSHAPPSEMSYLASQFKNEVGEVEVSFLPFEFNPQHPFDNATKLAQEMLPSSVGKLRLTVDIEWFVHSNGTNGVLSGGGSAAVHGRPAQKAFWAAWESSKPSAEQQQIRASFMARVQQADQWVNSLRKWAADHHVQSKLGFTFVPVLEDEFTSQKAYSNLVDAIRSQQAKDNSPTALRRSMNGSNSQDFRISGVSMEFHGSWSDAKTKVLSGDTWSNDGTVYGINGAKAGANNNFVSDAKEAKRKGVSVLYWNSDMNGTEKKDTNWASRPLSVFSGTTASANKARLTLVLEI